MPTFNVVKKGFDQEEVQEYINKISEEYQSVLNELDEAKQSNQKLKKNLQETENRCNQLETQMPVEDEETKKRNEADAQAIAAALIGAQVNARQIVEDAEKEAQEIRNMAQLDQEKTLSEMKYQKDQMEKQMQEEIQMLQNEKEDIVSELSVLKDRIIALTN